MQQVLARQLQTPNCMSLGDIRLSHVQADSQCAARAQPYSLLPPDIMAPPNVSGVLYHAVSNLRRTLYSSCGQRWPYDDALLELHIADDAVMFKADRLVPAAASAPRCGRWQTVVPGIR